MVGRGECEVASNPEPSRDADSGVGTEDDWILKPLPVTTEGVQCIMDIAEFKRDRPIFPVTKIV